MKPAYPLVALAASLAVLLSGPSLSGAIRGTPATVTFARINQKKVEVLELRQGTWRPIYQTPKEGVSDLSVAPSGGRLAMLAWTKGVVTGHDYSVQPRLDLVVIDTTGRTLATVPDVHKYDWCGSDRVAYIQGEYSEDSDWGFRPDGRWGLLEIATGKTAPLHGLRYPTAVAWNSLDTAIFVRDFSESPAIYRFDLRRGKLERAQVRDIQFSPSGRFSLSYPLELGNDSVQLYQTRSNRRVDISSLLRTADLVGWAGPGDVLLAVHHVPRPPRTPGERPRVRVIQPSDIKPLRYFLYRVSDGRVLAEEEGFLYELAGSADRRLIRQERSRRSSKDNNALPNPAHRTQVPATPQQSIPL
jgi:hypothetical protein